MTHDQQTLSTRPPFDKHTYKTAQAHRYPTHTAVRISRLHAGSHLRHEIGARSLVDLVCDLLEEVVAERVLHHVRKVRLSLAADLGHEGRVALVELKLEQPAPDLEENKDIRRRVKTRRGGGRMHLASAKFRQDP